MSYNLVTWQTAATPAGVARKTLKRSAAQGGDGFDDRILDGDTQQRTTNLFAAGPMLGGAESKRAPGQAFTFKVRLFAGSERPPSTPPDRHEPSRSKHPVTTTHLVGCHPPLRPTVTLRRIDGFGKQICHV